MITETQTVKPIGDLQQLREIARLYNYLLERKMELDHYLQYLLANRSPRAIAALQEVTKLRAYLLHLDDTRTQLVNPTPMYILTIEQALEAMRSGKRVAHRYMMDGEWLSRSGRHITNSEGHAITTLAFAKLYSGNQFKTGWAVLSIKANTPC